MKLNGATKSEEESAIGGKGGGEREKKTANVREAENKVSSTHYRNWKRGYRQKIDTQQQQQRGENNREKDCC